jgi:hypothetical protein
VLVNQKDGEISYVDNLSVAEYAEVAADDLLEVIFEDGKVVGEISLGEVRANLLKNL